MSVGECFFLVPAHSDCPGQNPESHKMVMCVCVCVVVVVVVVVAIAVAAAAAAAVIITDFSVQ